MLEHGKEPRRGVWLRAWLPVLLWIALILSASGETFSDARTGTWLNTLLSFVMEVSADTLDTTHLIVRKLAHLIEYGVLGVLAYRASQCTWPHRQVARWVGATMLLGAACAMLDELRQWSVASRTGSLSDVSLDVVGVGLGALVTWHLIRRSVKRPSALESRVSG